MTEARKKIEMPIWSIVILLAVVGLFIFVFFRLRKKHERLERKMTLLLKSASEPLQTDKVPPQASDEQAANMEEERESFDEAMQDAVTTGDADVFEVPMRITIPASLRYRITILNEHSFYAFSTANNGRFVHAYKNQDDLQFVLSDSEKELLTETRIWPVSEKEIGTILNRMLQTPKTS